ncbi:hypothetical protein HanPSC8_Chr10g0419091 [Helianthus annuus]|nr:hypothetical protein HanPSC8_Chr10g0419091 [Helianthus annuus]
MVLNPALIDSQLLKFRVFILRNHPGCPSVASRLYADLGTVRISCLNKPLSDLPWSLCCTEVLTCSPGSLA